jgi:hypothetical protein
MSDGAGGYAEFPFVAEFYGYVSPYAARGDVAFFVDMARELIYYVTYPDGRQERLVHRFPMRYLFRFEVEHLLARCGFALEAVYSDYDRSPDGSKYPGELICVARKMRGRAPQR